MIEKEIIDRQSKIIQEEIDWGVLCSIYEEIGWTIIHIDWDKKPLDEAYEIKVWCKDNLKGHYQSRGKTWMFELEKDASMFIMRWV